MRTNAGFVIIASEKNNRDEEIVLGCHPFDNGYKYVTWTCYNGNDYNFGHYFTDINKAVRDYNARVKNAR